MLLISLGQYNLFLYIKTDFYMRVIWGRNGNQRNIPFIFDVIREEA